MNTIRAFIALSMPDEVKRTVTAVRGQLETTVPPGSVRWVEPNALHLTLRFLGQTDDQLVPDIGRTLERVVAPLSPMTLRLDRLSAFPNKKRPRALWLGLVPIVPTTDETLTTLKQSIDDALEPFGWLPEMKPFTPHLTLGRVRDRGPGKGTHYDDVPWSMEIPEATFTVTAVHLIESDLRPEGPVYTVRYKGLMQGAG